MIPNLSIFFMAVTALVSIGLPIFMFFFWRKKYNLKAMPMLLGIAVFVVFALFLQGFVHSAVLSPGEDGMVALVERNPWAFVIYVILAAGIFEETGRFAAFHILKKNHHDIGTGLSYGIGHGGIEAFLLVGMTMISNIAVCLMINSGNTAGFGEELDITALVSVLQDTPSAVFLVGGFERVVAIAAHISLSIVVLCSVLKKDKLWLYPVAIVLHAVLNLAPAMLQAGFIESIWLVEGLILIPAALCAFAAIKACKFLAKEEPVVQNVNEPMGPTL